MTKTELLSNFGSETWFKNEVNKTLFTKKNIDFFNLKFTDTLHDFSKSYMKEIETNGDLEVLHPEFNCEADKEMI